MQRGSQLLILCCEPRSDQGGFSGCKKLFTPEFIKDPDNKKNIMDLLNSGINLNYLSHTTNYKVVVVTGKFLTLSRDEIINDLTKLGYRVSNTVSKKTEFLICGEKPGSKQKKANDLGIEIIYEDELIKLLAKAH